MNTGPALIPEINVSVMNAQGHDLPDFAAPTSLGYSYNSYLQRLAMFLCYQPVTC